MEGFPERRWELQPEGDVLFEALSPGLWFVVDKSSRTFWILLKIHVGVRINVLVSAGSSGGDCRSTVFRKTTLKPDKEPPVSSWTHSSSDPGLTDPRRPRRGLDLDLTCWWIASLDWTPVRLMDLRHDVPEQFSWRPRSAVVHNLDHVLLKLDGSFKAKLGAKLVRPRPQKH